MATQTEPGHAADPHGKADPSRRLEELLADGDHRVLAGGVVGPDPGSTRRCWRSERRRGPRLVWPRSEETPGIPWITRHRLTPRTRVHAESGPSHGSVLLATPALLHTTCTEPKRSTAALAKVSTAALSLTSVWTASASTPSASILSAALASAGACRIQRDGRAGLRVRSALRALAQCLLPAPLTTAT